MICKVVELSSVPELVVQVTAAGPRGKSAYETAREAGFPGSEVEFGAGLSEAAGGASVVAYQNRAAFPADGREGVLYLACDENQLYRYSGTDGAYHTLGAPREAVAVIHGGKAKG